MVCAVTRSFAPKKTGMNYLRFLIFCWWLAYSARYIAGFASFRDRFEDDLIVFAYTLCPLT